MKTLDELQHDLQCIYNEIEKIKVAQQSEKDGTMNFREISSKAKRYPITNHPMSEQDEYSKQMYLLMLLSVAHLDDTAYDDSLLTIYRIAHGMKFYGNVEEVFLSAKQMNFDKIDECTRLFLDGDLKLILLLDCMLVTAKFDKGKRQAIEYIANLCSLLKITKEQFTFLGNTARVILTQDLNQYKCDIPNTYGTLFDCYLDNLIEVTPISIELKKENLENQYNIPLTKIEITKEENNLKIIYHYESKRQGMFGAFYSSIDYTIKKLNSNYYNMLVDSVFTKDLGFKCKTYNIGVEYNHLLAYSRALKMIEILGKEL